MKILAVLLAGFAATSLMTLFSYVYSNMVSKHFREPELLNSLIARSEKIGLSPSRKSFLGWLAHYAIGWAFVAIFSLIWMYTPFRAGSLSGSVLGLLAGIVGIAGWSTMFKLNDNPPEIDLSQFYLQLVIAHVIFGVVAGMVFAYIG